MAGAFDPSAVPWPFVLAFASLGIIYALFLRRSDRFEEIGFSGKEVALLCLGSIAGWAMNIPVVPLGNTYLAVNLGGALVPVVLIGIWARAKKLLAFRALVGALLVSAVTYRIVRFDPNQGIVATFPWFFLPTAVALAYGLVVTVGKPMRAVPVAYTAGSMGALLGADVYNYPVIAAHFRESGESSLVSMGGAGVFDMVFLAGTLAMALALAVGMVVDRRARPEAPALPPYPTKAIAIDDSSRAWLAFLRLDNPTPTERAHAMIALSNTAMREGDFARATRLARLAAETVAASTETAVALAQTRPLADDLAQLAAAGERAKDPDGGVTRREAGDANETAKRMIASLGARSRLGGA